MKGIYIMNQAPFSLVYPEYIRNEIDQLVDIHHDVMSTEEVKRDPSVLKEVDLILSGWGGPTLDETFLQHAPNLKAFFYAAGSLKTIVTDAAWERNITITNAVHANSVPVVEFTLTQLLFCLKRGWHFVRMIEENRTYPSKPYQLSGGFRSKVGIISMSTVGRGVCELLKHFDLDVYAYDPFMTKEEAEYYQVTPTSIDAIFEQCDIVSLHAPLLEETRNLIEGKHFQSMKENSSFINTARGAIVNQEEMTKALQRRPDITAVLDVTNPEPPPADSVLYDMKNVILTPHLAGSEGAECGRMGHYMLEELTRFLNNEPLKWQINQERFSSLA
ncbi:hydroxyacid dehydrogenase [Gracilibacillus massiliensis]|uniref:hydroxyacid dehydrogenase n=1 Tax=Gracilibacillus massiliensis TaxID=1564956 RepID=UPI000AE6003E|nr:hydroxyacid dehydrogenase [Gracilibacillus massiliensis]